eukprot:TRINITY_DN1689_c0_g2_i3.p1 TRINITY_DN1689_c0_g2~~TRINITY_DN1689_c0_g2_i3.p1  ORF type:complete len:263 (-),score=58.73 TRINITY_DN1689_c0_g2_i3:77-865(-)
MNERIPGAKYYDLTYIANKGGANPLMLPTENVFKEAMEKLKIRKTDTVVCYDNSGIFASPRVWWTMKVYGLHNAYVLNGGFPKWKKEKLPIEGGEETSETIQGKKTSDSFNYIQDPKKTLDLEMILKIIKLKKDKKISYQIIDARPESRFKGTADEPFKIYRKGHIPEALNIPFASLLNEDKTQYRTVSEIQKIVKAKCIDLNIPITSYCGSGVLACVMLLGLDEAGAKSLTLYDGSWAEFGSKDEANWDKISANLSDLCKL